MYVVGRGNFRVRSVGLDCLKEDLEIEFRTVGAPAHDRSGLVGLQKAMQAVIQPHSLSRSTSPTFRAYSDLKQLVLVPFSTKLYTANNRLAVEAL